MKTATSQLASLALGSMARTRARLNRALELHWANDSKSREALTKAEQLLEEAQELVLEAMNHAQQYEQATKKVEA